MKHVGISWAKELMIQCFVWCYFADANWAAALYFSPKFSQEHQIPPPARPTKHPWYEVPTVPGCLNGSGWEGQGGDKKVAVPTHLCKVSVTDKGIKYFLLQQSWAALASSCVYGEGIWGRIFTLAIILSSNLISFLCPDPIIRINPLKKNSNKLAWVKFRLILQNF